METNAPSRREFLAAGSAAAGLVVGLAPSARGQDATREVRCGFIGVGGRGSTVLGETVKVPGVKVVGICDIDAEHRKRASGTVRDAGGAPPEEFDDWKKLLAKPDVEVIISALPCDLHYPAYRDVLAAGKHLYGEKPLCLTVAHADDLVKRVRESGKVFQIGFQRRFHETYRASVKAFRDGIIGAPFEGRGVRFGSGGMHRKPGEWFSFRARSGDWMLEQAVHHWDGLCWALGELPVSAYGTGHQDLFKHLDPQRDVSDYYTATIKYKNGMILTWTHTWWAPPDSHFRGMYEQLVGPKGGIDLSAGIVALRDKKGRRQLKEHDKENLTLLAVRDFFDCVRTGRKPVVGVEDGRNATLFGLLVRKAVYEERTVTMEEILKEA